MGEKKKRILIESLFNSIAHPRILRLIEETSGSDCPKTMQPYGRPKPATPCHAKVSEELRRASRPGAMTDPAATRPQAFYFNLSKWRAKFDYDTWRPHDMRRCFIQIHRLTQPFCRVLLNIFNSPHWVWRMSILSYSSKIRKPGSFYINIFFLYIPQKAFFFLDYIGRWSIYLY